MFTMSFLPKKALFLVVLFVAIFCCFLSIRHFEVAFTSLNPQLRQMESAPVFFQDDDFVGKANQSSGEGKTLLFHQHLNSTPRVTGLESCVTPEELQSKLRRCRQAAEVRKHECNAVHANPDLYWRSQANRKTDTHRDDFRRMNLASQCCAFNYLSVIKHSPRDPAFPWEKDFLCNAPPLLKMEDTAYASRSSIRLLTKASAGGSGGGVAGGEVEFTVGDQVQFEVIVRNGRGDLRTLGRDSVRVWLVSSDLGASVVADVVDLKNGSYIATSVLPWVGKVKVKATIAHTRELFRTVHVIGRYFGGSQWFTAVFQKGRYSEATPCSPYPALPAFPANQICNLTDRNGGFPWYCGKPVKIYLNCSDYVSVRKIDSPGLLPLTAAEEELIELTETRRPFLIPSNVSLTVKNGLNKEGSTLPLPSLPCNKRDLTLTFKETDQSGYLFGNVWRPFTCRLPNVTADFLKQCLKDTQFLYLGDSNSRLQMDLMTPLVNCKNKIARSKTNWHAPLWCDLDQLKISIQYYPPMHPFYGSVGEYIEPKNLVSPLQKMDSIPATGKYIVHLHNFLHFAPFHLGLMEQRLHLLRAAAVRLLARNPHVFIIYQSTHSAYDRIPKNKHKLNTFMVELQEKIMAGLGPRVMFVRTLPITIAKENTLGHPKCSDQFLNLYMGHICGREHS